MWHSSCLHFCSLQKLYALDKSFGGILVSVCSPFVIQALLTSHFLSNSILTHQNRTKHHLIVIFSNTEWLKLAACSQLYLQSAKEGGRLLKWKLEITGYILDGWNKRVDGWMFWIHKVEDKEGIIGFRSPQKLTLLVSRRLLLLQHLASIHFLCRVAGVYSSCHRVRGEVHPGQITSLTQS